MILCMSVIGFYWEGEGLRCRYVHRSKQLLLGTTILYCGGVCLGWREGFTFRGYSGVHPVFLFWLTSLCRLSSWRNYIAHLFLSSFFVLSICRPVTQNSSDAIIAIASV